MLVLSRKENEEVYIIIGDRIVKIMLVELRGDKARLGFEADSDIQVHRKEVYEAIQREKEEEKRKLNLPPE